MCHVPCLKTGNLEGKPIEAAHAKCKFCHVAFDIQTATSKKESGNTKVIAVIDVFIRYVHAAPISGE